MKLPDGPFEGRFFSLMKTPYREPILKRLAPKKGQMDLLAAVVAPPAKVREQEKSKRPISDHLA